LPDLGDGGVGARADEDSAVGEGCGEVEVVQVVVVVELFVGDPEGVWGAGAVEVDAEEVGCGRWVGGWEVERVLRAEGV